jgi:hypothetical protein
MVLSVIVLICFYLHISFEPSWEELKIRPTDQKAPIYSTLGLFTSIVGALAFGKPFTPTVIIAVGFVFNPIIAGLFGLPGMVDWVEKLISFVVYFVILGMYLWRWWKK